MDRAALEMIIRAREELSGMDNTINKMKQMRTTFQKTANAVKSNARRMIAALGALKTAVTKLRNLFRTLRNVALRAAMAMVAFSAAIGKITSMASSVVELDNVIEQTFGENAWKITEWAEYTGNVMGRSTHQMREYVGYLGAMLRPMYGMTEQTEVMSKNLAKLAVDIGSFFEVPDEQAFEAIKSGIMGMVKPLRRYGIDVTIATLQQYAFDKGIDRSIETMTQAQKVQLRYQYLMEKLPHIMGDAERTIDTYANQWKVLQANADETARTIGMAIMPILNDLMHMINDFPWEALSKTVVNFIKENKEAIISVITFGLKMAGVVSAIILVGSALLALTTTIGQIIVAIGILGAAWYVNAWGIREKTEEAVDYVIEKWGELKDWWQDTTWLEKAQDIGKLVLVIADWGWKALTDIYESLSDWMLENYDLDNDGKLSAREAIQPILNILNWGWEQLVSIYESLGDWILDNYDIDKDGKISAREALKPIVGISGWGWDVLKSILDSLKNKIYELLGIKEGETLTFDDVIKVAIRVSISTIKGIQDIGKQIWDLITGSKSSIEEQIEKQVGNTGLSELLKSIYVAEGGETASVPYGMTGFKNQGFKFAKSANQEFFEGIEEALKLEPHTEEWFAAASATTVTHYWENFKKEYELKGDTTLSDLSKKMENKFIEYLGSNYAPLNHHELNEHWVPNIKELIKEQKAVESIEPIEVAIDIVLTLGMVTTAFTAAKLSSAILAAIKSILIFGATSGLALATGGVQAVGALGAGLIIGAALSIALDPEIENMEEWKDSFMEGLDYLFSKEFWQDIWTIVESEWQIMWMDIEKWTNEQITQFFTKDYWVGVFENLKEAWKEIWEDLWSVPEEERKQNSKIKKQMQDDSYVPFNPFFASGGKVSGPGTGTSDSILAMLSNGEYVVNAKATRRFLPLLEAINNGVPAFAAGGLAGFDSGGYVEENQAALQAAKLQDNEALVYLATIAKDTENFQHIVDLIAGFKNLASDFEAMKKEVEERQKELEEKYGKDLEAILEELENQTETFEGSITSLGNQLANFANNISQVTGSSGAGMLGGVLSAGVKGYEQWQDFQSSSNLLGKLTSGLGMVNAAFSAIGAVQDWIGERNKKAEQEWQEQIKIDQDQLERLKAIDENTKNTTENIVKFLSQNPTTTNIEKSKSVLEGLQNNLTQTLIPEFGKIAIKANLRGGLFGFINSSKTEKYDPLRLMKEMGYDTPSGNIVDLGYSQLTDVYEEAKKVSSGDLKEVAKTIKDYGLYLGGGVLESWSSNWSSFVEKLKTYTATVKDLESALKDLAQGARYETFEGVEWLEASERVEQYRQQIEDLYTQAGKNVNKHQKAINKQVKAYADAIVDGGERLITIMSDVRKSFVDAFSGGQSALKSFATALEPLFSSIKTNISNLFYDIEIDELDSDFKAFFARITDLLADYSGDNIFGAITEAMEDGELQELFTEMLDMYENMEDMESINEIIIEQFTEQAEAAGLTTDEIDKMLELMGLTDEEAEKIAMSLQDLKNSLQTAMEAAMESGVLNDFNKALGEAIYNSAKDGLIEAFMESEVYQKMFEKWFDTQDIDFTGNLEEDFVMMNDMLDDLRQRLAQAGLNFGYGDVPVEDEQDGEPYRGDDYYVPNGEEQPVTVVENHYHYDPRIENLYGDDKETLFEEFLDWKEEQEQDSA